MTEILNNYVTTVHGWVPSVLKVNVPFHDYDTVTVKHISYSSSTPSRSIKLIWCTYTNSFVTSMAFPMNGQGNESVVDASYDIVIKLNKSNTDMGFELFWYDDMSPNSTTVIKSSELACISITLEFNKYKNP